ncbi:DUF1330 domain-containing protein [Photobacterium sp. ZSDE20]|uniref:DUF1330 domain-containing protein n=1 Tax=Photobacterium pectinilyticum TaxID=2906793 RepID=A0ABT1N6M0_9GAMM|nr:DUF1330 domain-containing protein [Photobacterium sp. ZSDE20]MCQ1060393.1 DUF1330 domain-containing protein [Photobacterium sp. ZSDE20]MDD1827763.1 DUF1330 domain-containing protein [Photobacterium sp. ZSDE20]
MEVINQLTPSDKQIERLGNESDSGEIHLLNLFKFREKAVYPDGRKTTLSGKEAYEVDELWDAFVIVKYPSRKALLEMTSSEEFLALKAHREAGLEGLLNIETSIP